mgnify:CR=1 FL=1
MLASGVLVLNRSFLPVHITSVKRALTLLYQGIAKAVDKQYELLDFDSWADLAAHEQDDTVGLVGRAIRVPRIILLTEYDRLPKRGRDASLILQEAGYPVSELKGGLAGWAARKYPLEVKQLD